MKHIKYFFFFFLFSFSVSIFGQGNWRLIKNTRTGAEFMMPENTIEVDTLSTYLYASEVDDTEALNVHIFENADLDTSDPIFIEVLIQESGDILRAIAKILLLATNSEIVSLNEIFTDENRGMEIGISYNSPDFPYYSFIRYYFINGDFVAFTWTGEESILRSGASGVDSKRNIFFNSVRFE